MNSIEKETKEEQMNTLEKLSKLSIFGVLHIAHMMGKQVNKQLSNLGYSLQVEQLQMLLIIYHYESKGELSQQEIANILERNKAGIQRSVHTMQRDGYLRITPHEIDKRRNIITLTPAGKIVVEKAIESFSRIDHELSYYLTEDEKSVLNSIREKMIVHLKQQAQSNI